MTAATTLVTALCIGASAVLLHGISPVTAPVAYELELEDTDAGPVDVVDAAATVDAGGLGDPWDSAESVDDDLAVPGEPTDPPGPVVAPCVGRWCYTALDVLAALEGMGPRTRCVVRHEVGGVGYSPNIVSTTNDAGPVQVHLGGGKHAEALALGLDIWNPYEMVPWLQSEIARGQGDHWRPIALHLC